ncbi:MAG: long-chain-acyl-CoA synthetase [Candidatus Lokiarchaeota archaeon]|nr:long-chain-acyl-CoA synthetase [Candidatus Lokiarchaeota archaeon]
METNFTPKERAAYDRYTSEVKKLTENPNQSVGIYVEQFAESQPEKIALFFEDNSWTWKQFNEESNLYANFFLKLGLKPGDTIALMMENSPEYIFVTTGINKLQGINALVNVNQRRQALIHSIKIVEPKYLIVDGECLPFLVEVVNNLPLKKDQILILNNLKTTQSEYADLKSKLENISTENPKTTNNSTLTETGYYIYTSGTTGLPKAVIITNTAMPGNGVFYGYSITQANADDIILIANPLYHSLSICTAWGIATYAGATTVLRKKFSASNFWKDIHKYKITFTTYVGEIPRYILNQPPSEYEKKHTLKKMLGLGLRKDIWLKFKERFQIEHIFEYYSSTEGYGPIVNIDEVPGMIGRNNIQYHALAKVNPETGEFLKNHDGSYIKCESGDVGMSLMKIVDIENFTKYRNKEKTNQKIIRDVFEKGDAYFITGDLLELHDDLWLSFSDRFGDTFRWKGENVSTQEVENILNSHNSILMSAVYGIEIPNHEGKAGMAAIKFDPAIGFKSDEISRFVIQVLPKYSIPIFVRICDELEVTGSNKIRKSNLRKEGYNINEIKEPLYMWDSSVKKYIQFDNSKYQAIIKGKLEF